MCYEDVSVKQRIAQELSLCNQRINWLRKDLREIDGSPSSQYDSKYADYLEDKLRGQLRCLLEHRRALRASLRGM